jgi:translation initiation factor IF-2
MPRNRSGQAGLPGPGQGQARSGLNRPDRNGTRPGSGQVRAQVRARPGQARPGQAFQPGQARVRPGQGQVRPGGQGLWARAEIGQAGAVAS